jgi:hypothetical protein
VAGDPVAGIPVAGIPVAGIPVAAGPTNLLPIRCKRALVERLQCD